MRAYVCEVAQVHVVARDGFDAEHSRQLVLGDVKKNLPTFTGWEATYNLIMPCKWHGVEAQMYG